MAISTKLIKSRIKSVSNTKKITKAMEMVAASKMRKAVEKSLASREYAQLAWELLVNISKDNYIKHPLLRRGSGQKELVVLIAANKGLCGSYNVNIYKALHDYISNKENKKISIISVGRYAERYAKKLNLPVIGSFIDIPDNPDIENLRGLARLVQDEFISFNVDRVTLLFTNYKSALSNETIIRGLLPITAGNVEEMIHQTGSDKDDVDLVDKRNLALYLFEPNEEEVLNKVLPILTEVQIYQAILESFASEHSSRMMAMRNASESADEMVKELTLSFNKARQTAITQEITEIATGAQILS